MAKADLTYLIKKTEKDEEGNTISVTYKKNKRMEVWSYNPSECWQFSYLGALSIINRLIITHNDKVTKGLLVFELEACEDIR